MTKQDRIKLAIEKARIVEIFRNGKLIEIVFLFKKDWTTGKGRNRRTMSLPEMKISNEIKLYDLRTKRQCKGWILNGY